MSLSTRPRLLTAGVARSQPAGQRCVPDGDWTIPVARRLVVSCCTAALSAMADVDKKACLPLALSVAPPDGVADYSAFCVHWEVIVPEHRWISESGDIGKTEVNSVRPAQAMSLTVQPHSDLPRILTPKKVCEDSATSSPSCPMSS